MADPPQEAMYIEKVDSLRSRQMEAPEQPKMPQAI